MKRLIVLLGVVAAISIATAQTANVTVMGMVTDQTGAAIPGVSITATNTQTGAVKNVMTGEDGSYTILNIAPGFYTIQAERQGFSTDIQRNYQLLVGTTVTINFSMKPSSVNQTVEVSATANTLDMTQSQVSTVIEPTELTELPTIDRSFSDLAALSPGVYVSSVATGVASTAAGVSIGNSASYQTGYIVDGASIESDANGGEYANFAQDWIQEFSLVSQQPVAEYGGASGGFINALSRSGTNDLHGRVYGYFQNSALNATPAFSASKSASSQRRIGGMVGGPIRKNRLFYFVGYEDWYDDTSVPVNIPAAFLNPSQLVTNGNFPQVNSTQIATAKFNSTLNARNTVWARWNYQFENNTGSTLGGVVSPSAGGGSKVLAGIYVGAWDWSASPSTVNEIRADYNRTMTTSYQNCLSYLGNYPGYPAQPGSTIAGNPVGYWSNITYAQASSVQTRCGTRFGDQGNSDGHIDEILTHSHGRHQLKFGGEIHHYNELTPPPGLRNQADPAVQINGTSPFTFNLATEVAPVLLPNGAISTPGTLPISYSVHYQTRLTYDLPAFGYSWFGEDSWRTTPKLTLNLGLRYDIDRGATALDKIVPAGHNKINNVYNDVSPRFGFAWSPFKDTNTVFRGGVGLYYDKNNYRTYGAYASDTAFAAPGGVFSLTASRPSLNPYCFGNSTCSSGTVPGIDQEYLEFEMAKALTNFQLPSLPAPGTTDTITIGSTTLVIPAATYIGPNGTVISAPVAGTNDIAPNFTIPGDVQVSGGVARVFSPHFNASSDFIYIRGFDQVVVVNTNVNPATLAPPVNPNYTTDLQWNNEGYFKYYSLRTQAAFRDNRGDTMQVAYSLGWAWDNTVSAFSTGTSTGATNPFDLNVDYGPSANDARHIVYVSGIFNAPVGIKFAPIFSMNTGLPYTATTTSTTVAGCPSYYTQCYPVGYTKDSLRGNATIATNMRLSKQIHLGETRGLTLFLEGYNLINRASYGVNYVTNVASATFMRPTAIASPNREFQLGFRFDF
jgi:hypothetical protein